jgi:actin-related protein
MRDSKLHLNICTNHNVVIDHGTYTTKVGFSTQDNPTTVLPTVVGHGRHAGAMAALGLKDTYIGSQAQALRGILAISHPIKQGAVQNWDDLEALWEHIWSRELRAPPSDLPALLTHPPANTDDWYKMAEILVEKMEVPALYLANKSVMALYGGGQMTGISVDSGHDTTYIVPSYQGNPIQEATLTLKLGGKQISEQLMQELMNGKYSFPDDNFLLWRKKNKSKFTVSSRLEIIREMKVHTHIGR